MLLFLPAGLWGTHERQDGCFERLLIFHAQYTQTFLCSMLNMVWRKSLWPSVTVFAQEMDQMLELLTTFDV